ncbi:Kinesin light chain 3 [Podochytrium sp. JEL0797]|nr:Kinesin light chain 3 [Podochytrium sp. JEL0797]
MGALSIKTAAEKLDMCTTAIKDPLAMPTFGIRLSMIEKLIEDWGGRGMLEGLKTSYVVNQFIKPYTQKSGLSFCGKLLQSHDVTKQDAIHEANWFISHMWSNKFLETVDAIYAFFDSRQMTDRDSIVVWMDVFSHSQHDAVGSKPEEWWTNVFLSALKNCENVVFVMTDWDELAPLKRSWCIYEVYACVQTGSSFHVAMTQEASESFSEMMQTNPSRLHETLSGIQTERSLTHLDSDQSHIFHTLQTSLGSLQEMDRTLIVLFSHWAIAFLQRCVNLAEDPIDKATWLLSLGTLYQQIGCQDLAFPVLLESFDTFKSTSLPPSDPRLAQLNQLVDPTKAVETSFLLAVQANESHDYIESEKLFLQTLRFADKFPDVQGGGGDVDCVVESQKYLKELYKLQGRADLARQYDNKLRLLALYKRHGLVKGVTEDYEIQRAQLAATHHVNVGELDEAVTSYLELLEAQKHALGEFDESVVKSLKEVAELQAKTRRPLAAVKYTVEMYYRKGKGLMEVGEVDQAERMFLRAFDFDSSVEFGEGDVDYVIESVKGLVGLYKLQERPKMVKKYEDLLASALE